MRPFVIIRVSVWATKVFAATTTTSLIGHYYFVIAPCKPHALLFKYEALHYKRTNKIGNGNKVGH